MNELIDKYFAKRITVEEKQFLFTSMEEDETLKKEFLQMQNAVALAGWVSCDGDGELSREGKKRFMQFLFRKRMKRTLVLSMKYAAVVCLLAVATFFVTAHYMSEQSGRRFTVVTAPKGQRVKVDLPDGTVAWLSPCSQLRFSASFNDKNRIVELDGATFFDVAKNPDKPFVVAAKQYRVQVLGTKFHVSAYAESPEFETDLVEGAVHIYDSNNARNELFLQPKEKAVLCDDKLVKHPSCFDNEEYLKNGIISFQSETFGKVINQVSLWNEVHFTIRQSVDLTKKISGKFRQSDTVESILKALQGVTPFKYTIVDENQIIIY
ncbi:FecR family protein [uncultured Bacteroides sp.]|uniref:FecR family protein n=1 Tax=uncultured Bacteroides sp. TaxID=162156 RepID=UPI0025DAF59E|nr:FecR family protein [uncultured Bacteroides sp.]